MTKRKKWILRIGIVGLAVLLVLVSVWVICTLRANAILEGEIGKVKASGGTLNLMDLVPPSVEDGENAAIPLEQSFALTTQPEEPGDEAFDALLEDPAGAKEEEAAAVREWVEKNSQALPLVRRAFRRDRCRWDLDYSNPVTMPLPQLSKMHYAWQLLGAHALLEAREGRTDEAFDIVADMLHGTAVCYDEPILIMHLVRLAMLADTLQHLAPVLDLAAPGPEAAARLAKELESIDLRTAYEKAMQGERCFGVSAFGSVEEEGRKIIDLIACLEESGNHSLPVGTYMVAPAFIHRLDQAEYLRRMGELVDMSSHPYFEVRDKWETSAAEKKLPWYALMTAIVLPALKSSFQTSESGVARLAIARTALALRVHREAAGSFPESLGALVSGKFTEIPVDPFTGAPLLYLREGPYSCKVYSAGLDGVDDGGKALENHLEKGGDIVWKLVVVRAETD